ncbi:MAG: type II secretion system F family protein [Coriobacteriaceae bacterium]|nr:type II secretion system F family protein [Coriobacteriaceae bacterium]
MSEMSAFVAVACMAAGVSGFCLAISAKRVQGDALRQRGLREALRQAPARTSFALPRGRLPPLLRAIERESGQAHPAWLVRLAQARVWKLGFKDPPSMIARAGLSEHATPIGAYIVRAGETMAAMVVGGVAGGLFSPELSGVLAIVGAVAGFRRVPSALRATAAFRNAEMERHLSEMLEVVVLGLRSGLSFERSFGLYPRYFDTGLAHSMLRVCERWDTGLMSREEALRQLEAEYDSALLSRVVGSMIRSLRFGTSIADALESTAVEAREAHRAQMEEKVAKVAVKMMVPVGTLILPAMLLLVLGPVMLELVEGF